MKAEQFYLNETQLEAVERMRSISTKSFWARQFQAEATKGQKKFDVIFGVFLPAMCFLFDPIVFRDFSGGGSGGGGMLGVVKPFAYLFSYLSIMALLALLLWGEKLKWMNGFLGGLFAASAIVSFAIGVVLLPFSLLGLVVLIGVLGFTPLFTGFVFWRNAVRAYKMATPLLEKGVLIKMMILSALFAVLVPEIINYKLNQGMRTIKTGDAQTIRRTTKRLKLFAPLLNAREIYWKLRHSSDLDQERKAALEDAYRELGGDAPEIF